MSKWGKRIELNREEAMALFDAASAMLKREMAKGNIAQPLVSVVNKSAKLVEKFADDKRKLQEEQ